MITGYAKKKIIHIIGDLGPMSAPEVEKRCMRLIADYVTAGMTPSPELVDEYRAARDAVEENHRKWRETQDKR